MKLVLASKSPRRSEILKNAGIDFTIRVADADETIPEGTKPQDAVVFLAAKKSMAVERADDEVILGADTVVVLDDKILGKHTPRMLRRMRILYNLGTSGQVHREPQRKEHTPRDKRDCKNGRLQRVSFGPWRAVGKHVHDERTQKRIMCKMLTSLVHTAKDMS